MARITGRKRSLLLLTALSIALMFGAAWLMPAWAGPGGIIKAAAKTFWGKVFMAGLILFFLPLIVWFSVRRRILVRRTKKVLRQLAETVPYFDWLELRGRISEVFLWVHSAWDLKKMEMAAGHVTPWYVQNQQLLLDKWEREGLENVVSNVQIKDITPIFVAHDPLAPDKDRIVVEIDAEMRDLVEKATGTVVEGDRTLGRVDTVWSFLRDGDRWVLNRIEEAGSAMDYLTEPDRVPAPAGESAA